MKKGLILPLEQQQLTALFFFNIHSNSTVRGKKGHETLQNL